MVIQHKKYCDVEYIGINGTKKRISYENENDVIILPEIVALLKKESLDVQGFQYIKAVCSRRINTTLTYYAWFNEYLASSPTILERLKSLELRVSELILNPNVSIINILILATHVESYKSLKKVGFRSQDLIAMWLPIESLKNLLEFADNIAELVPQKSDKNKFINLLLNTDGQDLLRLLQCNKEKRNDNIKPLEERENKFFENLGEIISNWKEKSRNYKDLKCNIKSYICSADQKDPELVADIIKKIRVLKITKPPRQRFREMLGLKENSLVRKCIDWIFSKVILFLGGQLKQESWNFNSLQIADKLEIIYPHLPSIVEIENNKPGS